MSTASPAEPELSVIVATHNRRDLLRRCIDSLARQTAPPTSFEVIVADDGSNDGTTAMAEALRPPFRIRILELPKSGHAVAQNAAIELAAAPYCLLLDDDVIASPDLVGGHIEGHRQHPGAIGIGSLTQRPVDAQDWFAHAVARGWSEHYDDLERRPAHWTDCYGANLSFPTAAIRELGAVSTDIPSAKDFDLALRLCAAGLTPVYFPHAHGVHDDQKRSSKMLVDAQRAGRMHVELSRRFPAAAPELLDWQGGAGPVELRLRRWSLALHVPLRPLVALGRFLPGDGRKMIWLHFVRRYAFWRGVAESVDGRTFRRLVEADRAAPTGEPVVQDGVR